MAAVNSEITAVLYEEVTGLVEEIESILFNEPLEQEALDDLLDKLRGVCRLLMLDAAVILLDEFKKTINFIIDRGNSPIAHQTELSVILDAYPQQFKVLHQCELSSPFVFMPELAVLKRIQGLPPVYEFQLVKNHHWPPAAHFKGASEIDSESRGALKKLKQLYQMGLLEILRGRDRAKGSEIIAKVASKLRLVFTSEAENKYWALVECVASGLRDGRLSFNPVRMRLLAAVERQLKTLIDGVDDPAKAYPLGLWRAYGILLSLMPDKSDDEQVLWAWIGAPDFNLTDADILGYRTAIFGSDEGVDEQSLAELSAQIGSLHNILELMDSQGQLSDEESEEFGRLVETIALLCDQEGLTNAAARFKEHHSAVAQSKEALGQSGSELLREAAHSILYLECMLVNLREQGAVRKEYIAKLNAREVDDVVEEKLVYASIYAAWSECLGKLVSAKEVFEDIVNDLAGSEMAEPLLKDLQEIEGAARIIGEPQVVNIVSRCRQFVGEKLFSLAPDSKADLMASFADAVVALEYYFQNTSKGEKSDFVLDIAADYLTALEAA